MKTWLSFLILSSVLLSFSCCQQAKKAENTSQLVRLQGPAMGTTYKIIYRDSLERNLKPQLEELLEDINKSLSTYDPKSTITAFNKKDSLVTSDKMLRYMVETSFQLAKATDGAFDPTIFPLSQFWGFNGERKSEIDTVQLDSIRALVGYDKIQLTPYSDGGYLLSKKSPNVQINFNAVAKGYGVDLLAIQLQNEGITDFLVDIGGEMVAGGEKAAGIPWRIAINYPEVDKPGATKAAGFMPLKNAAIATSGNYRNFYEIDGRKLVHTINPKTGYAQENDLLSASIIVQDKANKFGSDLLNKTSLHPCAIADAYATACMAMGFEKAKTFVETLEGIDAILIYVDDKNEVSTYQTAGVPLEKLD